MCRSTAPKTVFGGIVSSSSGSHDRRMGSCLPCASPTLPPQGKLVAYGVATCVVMHPPWRPATHCSVTTTTTSSHPRSSLATPVPSQASQCFATAPAATKHPSTSGAATLTPSAASSSSSSPTPATLTSHASESGSSSASCRSSLQSDAGSAAAAPSFQAPSAASESLRRNSSNSGGGSRTAVEQQQQQHMEGPKTATAAAPGGGGSPHKPKPQPHSHHVFVRSWRRDGGHWIPIYSETAKELHQHQRDGDARGGVAAAAAAWGARKSSSCPPALAPAAGGAASARAKVRSLSAVLPAAAAEQTSDHAGSGASLAAPMPPSGCLPAAAAAPNARALGREPGRFHAAVRPLAASGGAECTWDGLPDLVPRLAGEQHVCGGEEAGAVATDAATAAAVAEPAISEAASYAAAEGSGCVPSSPGFLWEEVAAVAATGGLTPAPTPVDLTSAVAAAAEQQQLPSPRLLLELLNPVFLHRATSPRPDGCCGREAADGGVDGGDAIAGDDDDDLFSFDAFCTCQGRHSGQGLCCGMCPMPMPLNPLFSFASLNTAEVSLGPVSCTGGMGPVFVRQVSPQQQDEQARLSGPRDSAAQQEEPSTDDAPAAEMAITAREPGSPPFATTAAWWTRPGVSACTTTCVMATLLVSRCLRKSGPKTFIRPMPKWAQDEAPQEWRQPVAMPRMQPATAKATTVGARFPACVAPAIAIGGCVAAAVALPEAAAGQEGVPAASQRGSLSREFEAEQLLPAEEAVEGGRALWWHTAPAWAPRDAASGDVHALALLPPWM